MAATFLLSDLDNELLVVGIVNFSKGEYGVLS